MLNAILTVLHHHHHFLKRKKRKKKKSEVYEVFSFKRHASDSEENYPHINLMKVNNYTDMNSQTIHEG